MGGLASLKESQSMKPFLLAPSDDVTQEGSQQLFDFLQNKTYYVHLPVPQAKQFRGSSYGWVVAAEDTPSICLINPLTGVEIHLPPRTGFPDVKQYRNSKRQGKRYIMRCSYGDNYSRPADEVRDCLLQKIILSCSPHLKDNDNDFVAVAIYGEFRQLAYCKYGDKKWTAFPINDCFCDIIFYEGQLYALNEEGQLYIIKMGPCPHPIVTKQNPRIEVFDHVKYLIESSVGLLMVSRHSIYLDDESEDLYGPYKTIELKVFMFDFSGWNWRRVTSIGDNVLFLGHNSSVSLPSDQFLGAGNKIYFTDNLNDFHGVNVIGGFDIGVFDLNSRTIESLSGFNCDPRFIFPDPVWVIPSAE